MDTIIRKMQIDDYDGICELWKSCDGIGLNSYDDSVDGIERFLDRNPTTCFVAVNDSVIVGAIMAGNDGRRGYIYHTAVNPQYRNQGIAHRLVENAENALGKLGIRKIALVVFNSNDIGNAFWENIGFTARDDLVYRNKASDNGGMGKFGDNRR